MGNINYKYTDTNAGVSIVHYLHDDIDCHEVTQATGEEDLVKNWRLKIFIQKL